jgi:hypothetical protein
MKKCAFLLAAALAVTPSAADPSGDVPVTYYAFVEDPGSGLPAGSLEILPGILALAPVTSDRTCSAGDTGAYVTAALEEMITDPGNEWGGDVRVSEVTFSPDGGHATVSLEGEVLAPADIVLMAFGDQVLLTVFADGSVRSAAVTIDGECIGNLGISHESEELDPGHVYTRSDVEGMLSGY